MRATLQNVGQTISIALFFGIIISVLSSQLPASFASSLSSAGAPQLASVFAEIPPTSALFAAFLGYNPVASILQQLPSQLVSSIPQSTVAILQSKTWFPNAVAPAFMISLRTAFYVASALAIIAAIASAMRGAPLIYEIHDVKGSKDDNPEKK
jgi:hypothetical protein